jgi:hypothetical protein
MKYSPSRPVRARNFLESADPTRRVTAARPEGASQRQPESPYDRALNRSAITWLHDLPRTVRPRAAPLRFPRILNRLARYWDSPAMLDTVFDELLVDRRLGRKGFPAEILAEIRALYVFHKARKPALAETDTWSAEPDRFKSTRWRV